MLNVEMMGKFCGYASGVLMDFNKVAPNVTTANSDPVLTRQRGMDLDF